MAGAKPLTGGIRVCRLDELGEGCSRGFTLEIDGAVLELFLVRAGDTVYAYENSCPHTGGPLDWVPDQFLNMDGDLIQCATHDALFRIHDGVCVAGPCAGDRLRPVRVRLEGGQVRVILDGPTG